MMAGSRVAAAQGDLLRFACARCGDMAEMGMRSAAKRAGEATSQHHHKLTRSRSWDDWVSQERIRKLTDENKELAANLRKDMDAQRRAASGKPSLTSTKKRGLGSDAPGSSARGSEDRSSVAPPPPPRGTKRAREIEGIDKVSFRFLPPLEFSSRLCDTTRSNALFNVGHRCGVTSSPHSCIGRAPLFPPDCLTMVLLCTALHMDRERAKLPLLAPQVSKS